MHGNTGSGSGLTKERLRSLNSVDGPTKKGPSSESEKSRQSCSTRIGRPIDERLKQKLVINHNENGNFNGIIRTFYEKLDVSLGHQSKKIKDLYNINMKSSNIFNLTSTLIHFVDSIDVILKNRPDKSVILLNSLKNLIENPEKADTLSEIIIFLVKERFLIEDLTKVIDLAKNSPNGPNEWLNFLMLLHFNEINFPVSELINLKIYNKIDFNALQKNILMHKKSDGLSEVIRNFILGHEISDSETQDQGLMGLLPPRTIVNDSVTQYRSKKRTISRYSSVMRQVESQNNQEDDSIGTTIASLKKLCDFSNRKSSKTTHSVVNRVIKTSHPFWYHFFFYSSYLKLSGEKILELLQKSQEENSFHDLAVFFYRASMFLTDKSNVKFDDIFRYQQDLTLRENAISSSFLIDLFLNSKSDYKKNLKIAINSGSNFSFLVKFLYFCKFNHIEFNDYHALRFILPRSNEISNEVFDQLQVLIYFLSNEKSKDQMIMNVLSLSKEDRKRFFENFFSQVLLPNSDPKEIFLNCFLCAANHLKYFKQDNYSFLQDDDRSIYAESNLDDTESVVEVRIEEYLTEDQGKFLEAIQKEFELRSIPFDQQVILEICTKGNLQNIFSRINDESHKAKFISDLGLICLEAYNHSVTDFSALKNLQSDKALQELVGLIRKFKTNPNRIMSPISKSSTDQISYGFAMVRPEIPETLKKSADLLDIKENVNLDLESLELTLKRLIKEKGRYISLDSNLNLESASSEYDQCINNLSELKRELKELSRQKSDEIKRIKKRAADNADKIDNADSGPLTEKISEIINQIDATQSRIIEADQKLKKSCESYKKVVIFSMMNRVSEHLDGASEIIDTLKQYNKREVLEAELINSRADSIRLANLLGSEEKDLSQIENANKKVNDARSRLKEYNNLEKKLRDSLHAIHQILTGNDPANGNLSLETMIAISNLTIERGGIFLSDLIEILRRLKAADISLHTFSNVFTADRHHSAFRKFIEFLDARKINLKKVDLSDFYKIWSVLKEGSDFSSLVVLSESCNWLTHDVAIHSIIKASNNLNRFLGYMQSMFTGESISVLGEIGDILKKEIFLSLSDYSQHAELFYEIFHSLKKHKPELIKDFFNPIVIVKLATLFEKYPEFHADLILLIENVKKGYTLTYLIEEIEVFSSKELSLSRTINDVKENFSDVSSGIDLRRLSEWLGRIPDADYKDGSHVNLLDTDTARQISGENPASNTSHRYKKANKPAESIHSLTDNAMPESSNLSNRNATLSPEEKIQIALFTLVMNNIGVMGNFELSDASFFILCSAAQKPVGMVDGRLYVAAQDVKQMTPTVHLALKNLLEQYQNLQKKLQLQNISLDSEDMVKYPETLSLPDEFSCGINRNEEGTFEYSGKGKAQSQDSDDMDDIVGKLNNYEKTYKEFCDVLKAFKKQFENSVARNGMFARPSAGNDDGVTTSNAKTLGAAS